MICPEWDAVLRDGPSAEASEHLRTCASCRARKARLDRVRAVLRSEPTRADPQLAARTMAVVRTRRPNDPWLIPIRVACVGLGATVAVLLALRWPPASGDHDPPAVVASSRALESKPRRWTLEPQQKLRWPDLTLTGLRRAVVAADGERGLRLSEGAVRVARRPVADGTGWVLRTPTARVQLAGSLQAVVMADAESTRVAVERGSVRVAPAEPTEAWRTVRVGQQWTSNDRRLDVRPNADEVDGRGREAAASPTRSPGRQPAPPRPVLPAERRGTDRVAVADRLRREGRVDEALAVYRDVAQDREAHPYDAEYAVYQSATLLERTGRRRAALGALTRYAADARSAALLPERVRLAAELYLTLDELTRAAALVEDGSLPARASPVIEARVRVANALAHAHPRRAAKLIDSIDLSGIDPELARFALETKQRLENILMKP